MMLCFFAALVVPPAMGVCDPVICESAARFTASCLLEVLSALSCLSSAAALPDLVSAAGCAGTVFGFSAAVSIFVPQPVQNGAPGFNSLLHLGQKLIFYLTSEQMSLSRIHV